MIYFGGDNGSTGNYGVIYSDGWAEYRSYPVKRVQDYTKKKQEVTRLDAEEWMLELRDIVGRQPQDQIRIFLERPFVNYHGYAIKTSLNAVRFFEAQLVVIELLGISYDIIDSRMWQKELLPAGTKGPELKKKSLDIGIRLFPQLKETIRKMKDADGLLIAEWARRHNL
ncbi:MAG: hypothetical protein PVG39_01310 [Desulfobacteraceae bacterium]|jgi:hypothetical protein